jgi:hypothetical protein
VKIALNYSNPPPRLIKPLAIGALTAALAAPAFAGATSDKEIAKEGLLTLSDFPSGWTQSPHKDTQPSKLPACKATEAVVKQFKKYRTASPDFAQGRTTKAQNTIYAFPGVKQAKTFLKPYLGTGVTDCFEARIKKEIPDATVEVQKIPSSSIPSSDLADESFGFEVTLKSPGDSAANTLYFDALAYRVDRFFVGYTFQNLGDRLPDAPDLVAASLQRLVQAIPSG